MSVKEHLEAFLDYVNDMTKRTERGDDVFHGEFQSLKHRSVKYRKEKPSKHGELDVNMKKNRYKDILPFDETRVILPEIPDVAGSDYINANFIKGIDGKKNVYIAAQGPLPYTVGDFWRMLWHYEIEVVVMTCKTVEIAKPKCEQYWVDRGDERSFGDIKVTLKEQKQLSQNVILREICATKGSETRQIHQLHYTAWPDHGIPRSSLPIIKMMTDVRKIQPDDNKPIVLHCSAGCGRTGAVIVIDYVRKLIQSQKLDDTFCLFDVIDGMRQQRPAIVQTKEQYQFVHYAVFELVRDELQNKYQDYTQHLYENVNLEAESKPQLPIQLPEKTGTPSPVDRKRQNKNTHSYLNVQYSEEEPAWDTQSEAKPVPAPRSPSLAELRKTSSEKPTLVVRSKHASLEQTQMVGDDDYDGNSKQRGQQGETYERVKPGTVSSAKMAFMQELQEQALLKKKPPSEGQLKKEVKTDSKTPTKPAQPTVSQDQLTKFQQDNSNKMFDSSSNLGDEHEYEAVEMKRDFRERQKEGDVKKPPKDELGTKAQLENILAAELRTKQKQMADNGMSKKPENPGKAARSGGLQHDVVAETRQDEAYAVVADPKPRRQPRRHEYEDIEPVLPMSDSPKGENVTIEDESSEYAVVGPKRVVAKPAAVLPRSLSEDCNVMPPDLPDRTPASYQFVDEDDSSDITETASLDSHGSMESTDQKQSGSSESTESLSAAASALKLAKRFKFRMPGKKKSEDSSSAKPSQTSAKPVPPPASAKPDLPPASAKPAPPPASAKPTHMGRSSIPQNLHQDLEEYLRQVKRDHSPTFTPTPRVHHMQDISFPNRPFKTNGPRETPKRWQKPTASSTE